MKFYANSPNYHERKADIQRKYRARLKEKEAINPFDARTAKRK